MEELCDKIKKYKQGDIKALEEILIQMTPLVKNYAAKIHFMEYEDAMQELYIALLKCIPKLSVNALLECHDLALSCWVLPQISVLYIRQHYFCR